MERQLSGTGLLCEDGMEEKEVTAPLFENGRVLPSMAATGGGVGGGSEEEGGGEGGVGGAGKGERRGHGRRAAGGR